MRFRTLAHLHKSAHIGRVQIRFVAVYVLPEDAVYIYIYICIYIYT